MARGVTEGDFKLGQVVVTCGVNDRRTVDTVFARFAIDCLRRHAAGDWGDVSKDDKKQNDLSLKSDLRLLSAYERYPLPKIWIITEADRSVTTILFPEEY